MIGIIPAAGQATRMMGIPKMLLPVPSGSTLIDTMIGRMMQAGIGGMPEIISSGVVAELIEHHTGLTIHTRDTTTMSQTVLAFKSWWDFMSRTNRDGREQPSDKMPPVIFGMPDTYFDDHQAFVKLADVLNTADVAVGLFRTRPSQRHKLGMCDFDAQSQRLTMVFDKPKTTLLTWAWGVLAWRHTFWEYIHEADPHVGYALPRAIEAGLDVRAVKMDGDYFDCGTPDEYFECIEHLRRQAR